MCSLTIILAAVLFVMVRFLLLLIGVSICFFELK